MRIHLPIALLLLAGCSSHASKQDQLNAAANETTPEADNSLEGDANGMNEDVAPNEAARASAANTAAAASLNKEARPNPTHSASPQQPAEPSLDEPGNSNSD